MLIQAILVAHILVVGYWLGSDLVINSTFRYVSRASSMSFGDRDRLLEHVLDVDQHVRYALILQVSLGTAIGALLGYLPGGGALAGVATLFGIAWMALVELTHRLRRNQSGRSMALVDRAVRYAAILTAVLVAAGTLIGCFSIASWLAIKLALFAGVIASGLGIRIELIRYFQVWHAIRVEGSSDDHEQQLRYRYKTSTTILVLLWLLIATIVAVSVLKPG